MTRVCKIFVVTLCCFVLSLCKVSNVFSNGTYLLHKDFGLISPFQDNHQSAKAHCLANKHSLDKPCPHHIKSTNDGSDLILTNCTHPLLPDKIIGFSFAKDSLSCQEISILNNSELSFFPNFPFRFDSGFLMVVPPPPRFLF